MRSTDSTTSCPEISRHGLSTWALEQCITYMEGICLDMDHSTMRKLHIHNQNPSRITIISSEIHSFLLRAACFQEPNLLMVSLMFVLRPGTHKTASTLMPRSRWCCGNAGEAHQETNEEIWCWFVVKQNPQLAVSKCLPQLTDIYELFEEIIHAELWQDSRRAWSWDEAAGWYHSPQDVIHGINCFNHLKEFRNPTGIHFSNGWLVVCLGVSFTFLFFFSIFHLYIMIHITK